MIGGAEKLLTFKSCSKKEDSSIYLFQY